MEAVVDTEQEESLEIEGEAQSRQDVGGAEEDHQITEQQSGGTLDQDVE